MYKVEKILPNQQDNKPKSQQIEQMFDEIANRYDTMNHTMSLYFDNLWRKKGIKALSVINPKTILDVATGTGDLAIEAYKIIKPQKITGIDISEKMMSVGRKKVEKIGLQDKISFQRQNVMAMSFEDNSFDGIMVAFGIRNFEDLDKGLQEILRVLKRGGMLMILELSTPQNFLLKQGYILYSKIIPILGKLLSKNISAYRYLPKSISAFPQNREMTSILTKNGFSNVTFKSMTLGACTMYLAGKS